jgi:hypothetical protein
VLVNSNKDASGLCARQNAGRNSLIVGHRCGRCCGQRFRETLRATPDPYSCRWWNQRGPLVLHWSQLETAYRNGYALRFRDQTDPRQITRALGRFA